MLASPCASKIFEAKVAPPSLPLPVMTMLLGRLWVRGGHVQLTPPTCKDLVLGLGVAVQHPAPSRRLYFKTWKQASAKARKGRVFRYVCFLDRYLYACFLI